MTAAPLRGFTEYYTGGHKLTDVVQPRNVYLIGITDACPNH